jgi:hypothetical protein
MIRTTSLAAALVAGAVLINAGFAAVGSDSIGSARASASVPALATTTETTTETATAAAAAPAPAPAPRIALTSAGSTLVDRGLAKAAPAASELGAFEEVPHPALRFRIDNARATRAPWVDSNAWRYFRGLSKANYAKLPAGSAPLAAAEAFMFDADAVLNPDPKDLDALGTMLEFLAAQQQPAMPALANIEMVDDGAPTMGEILNLMTRRNLLYRVVKKAEGKLDLTVQIGSKDFSGADAANPYDFAAKVRDKLGDDKRLIRLYGTQTTIARLTSDGKRARLVLLEYGAARDRNMGGGPDQTLRVRLLGKYRPVKFAGFGTKDAKLTDVENPGATTEFWVPAFTTIAVIDLERM